MGKLIDIETIRKEIEKKLEFLKNQQEESGGFGALVLIGKNAAYNEVLSFLDDLPEEKIVNYLNVNLGSPDYARGFEHGKEAQKEQQYNWTDEDKVIDYLVNKKGYPICTSGNIPSYEETFETIKNAIEYQKSLEEKPVDIEDAIVDYYGNMPEDADKVNAALHFFAVGQTDSKMVEEKPLELKAGREYICHRAYCCRADHLTVKEGERFVCEKDGVVKGFEIDHPEQYFRELPEKPVDLEKEIEDWLNHGEITDTRYDDYDDRDIILTARKFFNLGRMAK